MDFPLSAVQNAKFNADISKYNGDTLNPLPPCSSRMFYLVKLKLFPPPQAPGKHHANILWVSYSPGTAYKGFFFGGGSAGA